MEGLGHTLLARIIAPDSFKYFTLKPRPAYGQPIPPRSVRSQRAGSFASRVWDGTGKASLREVVDGLAHAVPYVLPVKEYGIP